MFVKSSMCFRLALFAPTSLLRCKKLDLLNAATEYWINRWAQSKAFESSASFAHNMEQFISVRPGVHAQAVCDASQEAFVADKIVFVPLCGDTEAVSFFARSGAKLVVGIELCRDAVLQNIAQYFQNHHVSYVSAVRIEVRRAENDAQPHTLFLVDDLF